MNVNGVTEQFTRLEKIQKCFIAIQGILQNIDNQRRYMKRLYKKLDECVVLVAPKLNQAISDEVKEKANKLSDDIKNGRITPESIQKSYNEILQNWYMKPESEVSSGIVDPQIMDGAKLILAHSIIWRLSILLEPVLEKLQKLISEVKNRFPKISTKEENKIKEIKECDEIKKYKKFLALMRTIAEKILKFQEELGVKYSPEIQEPAQDLIQKFAKKLSELDMIEGKSNSTKKKFQEIRDLRDKLDEIIINDQMRYGSPGIVPELKQLTVQSSIG